MFYFKNYIKNKVNIQRSNDLEVAFEADWNKSWEPFYIAKHNVPLFDERFKQYGFDRIQQVYFEFVFYSC